MCDLPPYTLIWHYTFIRHTRVTCHCRRELYPYNGKKQTFLYSKNKSLNYRPVSLTSVICQLLETIIRDHMMDFLVKHKLINTSQHGFLKARSCLTNLLCFFEEITKWVDDGSPVHVIYLDFQKAFDKVPHQRLILKLKSHGMGNSIINWIEQWLTDRR